MMRFDPLSLQQWTHGVWTQQPTQVIECFCFDTRKSKNAFCFLAIPTERDDGHRYVKQAQELGASAAIVEHPIEGCTLPQLVVDNTLKAFQAIAACYRKTLATKIFAITGSCGKTTAKELLTLLLGEDTYKSPGTFNEQLGVPYSLVGIDPKQYSKAVLEVGINHPGEMEVLSSLLTPDVAILINANPVHLEHFNDVRHIAEEKLKLLQSATQVCYCPEEWSDLAPKDNLHGFPKNSTQLTSNGWDLAVDNNHFTIRYPLGDDTAQTFANMLWIAIQEGISPAVLQSRLEQWRPMDNRGAWHTNPKTHRSYFVDCYNANPVAFKNSLQQFYREKPSDSPVCYIIGSMLELGEKSVFYHISITQYFRVNPQDCFVCIGTFAKALQDGFLQRGAKPSQIYTFDKTDQVYSFIRSLQMSCFYLKGSRFYQLEQLVHGNVA